MVSKKSFKNQIPVSNRTKLDNNMTLDSEKFNVKPVFVSQKVIVGSIYDKSLIQRDVNVVLPDSLSVIFNEMISDMNYINETLRKKDYSFYGCNMGFLDAEQMISQKRKSLVDFMIRKQGERCRNINSEKNKHKVPSIICKKKSLKNSKASLKILTAISDEKRIVEINSKVENFGEPEKESELSSEPNNNFRPQRKRKKPSKFKNEEVSLNSKRKSISKSENDCLSDKSLYGEAPNKSSIIKGQKPYKIMKDNTDIIDLVETGNSSDSSSVETKKSLNCTTVSNFDKNSSETTVNKKMYFRKPIARKGSLLKSKALKEHTLLDKILLGINCVRKWTERGLQLSRLCETDLALLNKRLTSLDCVLSDLEEHTDENNNRYLSVLLQSNLFSSFVLAPSVTTQSQQPKPVNDSIPSPLSTGTSKESKDLCFSTNESSETNSINYSRQKSKPHVPVLYRQRHGVPSILSKPIMGIKSQHNTIDLNLCYKEAYGNQNNCTKIEEVTFPKLKFDDQALRCSGVSTKSNADVEVPMTASQLLRLKSQKSNAENHLSNQRINGVSISEEEKVGNRNNFAVNIPVIPQYPIPNNGFVSPDPSQSFILQTSNNNCTAIPFILLPKHTKVVPGIHIQNCQPRQICIPLQKPGNHRTITKIQRIPLHNNGLPNLTYRIQNPPQVTMSVEKNDQNKNFSSQSVILKNLLQQSSSSQILSSSIATASTSQMMSLSVFQNSQSRKSFVQFNPHQSFQR